MKYKSGYRYKLDEAYLYQLPFSAPNATVRDGWVVVINGQMGIANGYAWDGASTGLPWTPRKWLRPSLLHDAPYQLIREGKLPMELRADVDLAFYHNLRENGVSFVVATVAYWAVRLFGNYCLRKGHKTKEAP